MVAATLRLKLHHGFQQSQMRWNIRSYKAIFVNHFKINKQVFA